VVMEAIAAAESLKVMAGEVSRVIGRGSVCLCISRKLLVVL
jgi:hypothetical protein